MNASTRPTKSEIFTAYNKARAEARRAGDTKRIERLNRALGILQSHDYYRNGRAEYLPTLELCGCKDWEFRYAHKRAYAGPCKHMLAESLLVAIVLDRKSRDITRWIESTRLVEASHKL